MAALALSRRHRSALLIIIIIFIAALLFQRPYWLRNFSAPPLFATFAYSMPQF
jgi:hypothetical protein